MVVRDETEADVLIRDALQKTPQHAPMEDSLAGFVTLVGAGPGDPGLLTLDAVRALQEADSVLYDRLCPQAVLDLARPDADCVCVGKGKELNTDGAKQVQDFIEDELVRRAKLGERVVRLKGGDPYIFGRGGEEVVRLQDEGIMYSVVPGITTALAAGARVGIPLTMRNMATAVMFVTGNGKGKSLPYDMIVQQGSKLTTVIYMALGALPAISSELESRGLGKMPMACIENATLPDQRHIVGTVSTLPSLVTNASPPISSTSILILGDVCSLAARQASTRPELSAQASPPPASDGCCSFIKGIPHLLKELCNGSSRLELRVVRKVPISRS